MEQVDIVIPIYQPDKKLHLLMNRLMTQTVHPEHVYLIYTKAEKKRVQTEKMLQNIVSEYPQTKIIEIEEKSFDHGGTRDMAMNLCTSEYVLMMTQDAIPKNRKLIENLLKAQKSDVAVVYAKQGPEKECRIIEKYTRGFNYPEESSSAREIAEKTQNGIKAIFCSDVCAMYRRELYDKIGGFPKKTIFNEDEIYAAKALKAGYDVRYEASAVVIHSHNYSGLQYFRRYFDLGVSHADFRYIFEEYHSQDEGVRLVKDTLKYLLREQEYLEIPRLIYHSGMKFLGMKLGQQYKMLPKQVIVRCTSNQNYWKK